MQPSQKEIERICAINQPLIQELNTGSHSLTETRQLISQITGRSIDPTIEIRLPFL